MSLLGTNVHFISLGFQWSASLPKVWIYPGFQGSALDKELHQAKVIWYALDKRQDLPCGFSVENRTTVEIKRRK